MTDYTDTVSDPQPTGGDPLPSDEEPIQPHQLPAETGYEELEGPDSARDLAAPDGGH